MKIDLTRQQWLDIQIALLGTISMIEKCSKVELKENFLIQRNLKIHTLIADAIKKDTNPKKTENDPNDPYKRKYYASKGFYQQLTAADMMGLKSESSLVSYRKKGVLKEGVHWIRTVGRGISYKPELCKLAIEKAKLGY
tara:strand:- start:113 stop:529 length:417 start_codon:yes stop_codon:yes gene_type:complete